MGGRAVGYPGLRAPFMTPARGWACLVILSVALLIQGCVCAARYHVLMREFRACERQLPPTVDLQRHGLQPR